MGLYKIYYSNKKSSITKTEDSTNLLQEYKIIGSKIIKINLPNSMKVVDWFDKVYIKYIAVVVLNLDKNNKLYEKLLDTKFNNFKFNKKI